MSSIFGKYDKSANPTDLQDLQLMEHELNYWNADDTNTWINGRTGLGHLMLYNTPVSLHEKQPLHDDVSGLTITADARIDNREELYPLIGIETTEEKSIPDSGIILLLYKKYGADVVKYLIGDFAFAIWDERAHRLLCARDHMGVKPFFYYNGRDHFAFASEKKGLLCLKGIDKTIDKQFFYNQVLWPCIQAEDTTIYKNIRRLPPATTLTYYPLKDELSLNKYWTLDPYSEITLRSKEDYYEGLLHHFENAVKCRLNSHFRVGAELSGGMDSSAITGIASHFLKSKGSNIITFSNVGDGNELVYDTAPTDIEREHCEAVIKFNEIREHVFVMKDIWDDPLEEIDMALKINDGLEMWNLLWLLPIKKAAMERNVRTLLSGFPGDEMVTYRGQFYFLDHLDHKEYLKYFTARSERPFRKLKPFLSARMEFLIHKIRNILTLNHGEIKEISDIFNVPVLSRYTKGDVVWEDINHRERFKSYRHLQKYRLLKPQIGLRMEAETRFGLSYKTEPRFPMADIRLCQYYLSMPNNIKYEGTLSRNAYRIAVKKYIPEAIFKKDDKTGSTARFRDTKDILRKRQEATISLLHDICSNKYDNIINSKWFEKTNKQLSILELLRWYEENKRYL
jgi:asparagine synthase (glutamine-hydrolysing)